MPFQTPRLLSLCFLILLAVLVRADVVLAPIFSDNMVIQRGQPILLWGTADAGEKVTVDFHGHSQSTTADNGGAWRVQLPPLPANAQPAALTVTANNTLRLANILVGDLWFCAGQSNMFYPMASADPYPGSVPDFENEIAAATHPQIRLNSDEKHPLNKPGWHLCTPENIRGFSAVAYYFGLKLHRHLDVPIGLIVRARGGTSIQNWTPKNDALAVPVTKKYHDIATARRAEIQAYNRAHQTIVHWQRSPKNTPRPPAPKPLPPEVMSARSFGREGILFERFINPVGPIPLSGIIWYQGESNSESAEVAENYDTALTAFIASMRNFWQRPALPFGIVQLPNFNNGKHWPLTRESQRQAAARTHNTGLIVTIDIGDPADLHPADKKPVADRLADWALRDVYHRDKLPTFPIILTAQFAKNVSLTYDQPIQLTKSTDTEPAFEISADNQTWQPAAAQIRNENQLILSNENIPAPLAVRYAWRPNPQALLLNKTRLPAAPFLLEKSKN